MLNASVSQLFTESAPPPTVSSSPSPGGQRRNVVSLTNVESVSIMTSPTEWIVVRYLPDTKEVVVLVGDDSSTEPPEAVYSKVLGDEPDA